jgi:pyruvate kinase
MPDCAQPSSEAGQLTQQLGVVLMELDAAVARTGKELDRLPEAHRDSARNLLAWLALRRHDLRALQPRLAALGLSSLGRAESDVVAAVRAVQQALRALEDSAIAPTMPALPANLLTANTDALFGPAPSGRRTRIMVTMPSEAAADPELVQDLVRGGMDCMRINCAHDGPAAWASMIAHLRAANAAADRNCLVAMDLGGPKLRTGPLRPGPAVLRSRPLRDAFGRVVAPARIALVPTPRRGSVAVTGEAALSVPRRWLRLLSTGATVHLVDARGASRRLRVAESAPDGRTWVECRKTCYIVPGTKLHLGRSRRPKRRARVGSIPPREGFLRLRAGDDVVIERGFEPGRPARQNDRGEVIEPASIGCTLPQVFDDVKPGERIWFDDGAIGGVVAAVQQSRVEVHIDHAPPDGGKLRADKGINLPDSALNLPALTPADLRDLEFVVANADIVSLSFANAAADVELLQQHLLRLGGEHLGVVVKIETRRGFEALPAILLRLLRNVRCGVMIARGDLAVECGFERLAELQEEILWICEAAHVPVIWATQVLDKLARTGAPSRAEITDAAMSERAECVMLNKGPHVRAAVALLDDILRRMQSHAEKKRSLLRPLNLARRYLGEDAGT